MDAANDPRSEALAQHVAGVRRLARHLLRDPADAEDVAQESLLTAIERPAGVRDLGRWLRGVVRNKARESVRAQGRRARREAAGAREEGIAMEAVDVVARVEVQERLLAAVKALPEPYATALWMHHFEGSPAAEVAQRLSVPPETVRTRLRRGLDLLREDLDRRYGDRRAWAGALSPFAFPAGAVSATTGAAPVGSAAGVSLAAKVLPAAAVLVVAGAVAVAAGVFASDPPAAPAPSETSGTATRPATAGPPVGLRADPASPAGSRDGEPKGKAAAKPQGGAGLAPATVGARRAGRVGAHEALFDFHYQQGWSFVTRSVVPMEDGDVVFETCAGGISSVTLAAPGGAIVNLESTRDALPEVKSAKSLWEALLGGQETAVTHATETGDSRAPHSDVFLMRTRRGEWVKLAILERRDSHGGWTEDPVTITYALQPEAPRFGGRTGEKIGAFEIDRTALARIEQEAADAARVLAEQKERERLVRAVPVLRVQAELDRHAEELDTATRARSPDSRVGAVLARQFAMPLAGRDAYWAAAYSLEKGVRGGTSTRDDWDFVFGNPSPSIDVRLRTDDYSLIRDLGIVEFDRARQGGFPVGEGTERVPAIAGHTYVLHTLDSDSDFWALLRVLELVPKESMVFEWTLLDDPGALREALEPATREMREPYARLQIRGGAAGGNAHFVFLDGNPYYRVKVISKEPLDASKRPDSREEHRIHVEGAGLVPSGKLFVVESIEWAGRADGDSNGDGKLIVQVGGFQIVHVAEDRDSPREKKRRYVLRTIDGGLEPLTEDDFPVQGHLSVSIPVRRGLEQDVLIEIANCSACDLTLRGRFAPEGSVPNVAEVVGRGRSLDLSRQILGWGPETSLDTASQHFLGYGPSTIPWLESVLSFGLKEQQKRRLEAALERLRR